MTSSLSKQQRKTFVLDTSVLLSVGKRAFYVFKEHEVVLPLVVVDELEGKRHDPELGQMARSALNELDELRVKNNGALHAPVAVNDEGGTLWVEINHISMEDAEIPVSIRSGKHDMRILAVAKNLQKTDRKDVVLVTKDVPMRVKAGVVGVKSEAYRNDQVKDTGYVGIEEVEVDYTLIDELYENKVAAVDSLPNVPVINSGLVLTAGTKSALTTYGPDKQLHLVRGNREAWGVKGRSAEQRIALAHLMNTETTLVSLGGPAGTGKTMLALAAGIEQTLETREYEKVVVFRNMHAVGGQELGFLPGDEAEKMAPWAAAVYDALEAFCDKNTLDMVKRQGLVEVLPLTHIRGRTFTNAFIIVDEAQNLERSTILTALSRLGAGSKAVLSWDVAQRDNLHVGRHDGIHAVVEKLKDRRLFAHTTLVKSERSETAAMVAELLDDIDL